MPLVNFKGHTSLCYNSATSPIQGFLLCHYGEVLFLAKIKKFLCYPVQFCGLYPLKRKCIHAHKCLTHTSLPGPLFPLLLQSFSCDVYHLLGIIPLVHLLMGQGFQSHLLSKHLWYNIV